MNEEVVLIPQGVHTPVNENGNFVFRAGPFINRISRGAYFILEIFDININDIDGFAIEIQSPVSESRLILYEWDEIGETATSVRIFLCYPSYFFAGHLEPPIINNPLPFRYNLVVSHANANSLTYSVIAQYLL